PTFLYELVWDVAVAVLLVWADRRFRMGHGRVLARDRPAYPFGRFWIELLRTGPATHLLGVRINVFTSVVLFLAAVTYLIVVRGGREDLSSAGPAEPALAAGR